MAITTATTGAESNNRAMTGEEAKVILASSAGTVFEWYDFYLAGSLAANINATFFAGFDETSGFIFTLLSFAAGFAVRPFGALFFGRLGDLIGRKYTFLVTMIIMGLATFVVGLLPGAKTGIFGMFAGGIGYLAPVLFLACRLMQGLALGGEYGGAATYVAEHAPQGRRGFYTSWIQTTATVGLFLSLIVILALRLNLSPEDFAAWGWRVPFLVSILLLLVSIWIRLQLAESPAFLKMKEEGTSSKAPLGEAFGTWKNAKWAIVALLGATAGQAVVWYSGQFYALFFLTQTLKVDGTTANLLIAIALLIGTPFFIVFGWLSDKIGRKPIILGGCLLAALSYFTLFDLIAREANPALIDAQDKIKVNIVADPANCGSVFDPVNVKTFTRPCDIAKKALAAASIRYQFVATPGAEAKIVVGSKELALAKEYPAGVDANKKEYDALTSKIVASSVEAGYPKAGDARIIKAQSFGAIFSNASALKLIALLSILVLYVTMVYGPIAALLVELFPTRIRYTGMSLPYHIGNGWFGGFLPPTVFAIIAATGDIFAGLWYPVIVAAATFVIGVIFLPETYKRDIFKDDGK